MNLTDPKISASQFSIFASISNVGMIGGNGISGTLITLIGFTRTFLYSAWVLGPALLFLFIFSKLKKIND